jgi:DNA-binding CsgD family transcriptional regulator
MNLDDVADVLKSWDSQTFDRRLLTRLKYGISRRGTLKGRDVVLKVAFSSDGTVQSLKAFGNVLYAEGRKKNFSGGFLGDIAERYGLDLAVVSTSGNPDNEEGFHRKICFSRNLTDFSIGSLDALVSIIMAAQIEAFTQGYNLQNKFRVVSEEFRGNQRMRGYYEKILKLIKEGDTIDTLAKALGVSEKLAKYQYHTAKEYSRKKNLEFPVLARKKRQKSKGEFYEQIVSLIERGKNGAEIARELGYSEGSSRYLMSLARDYAAKKRIRILAPERRAGI